MPLYILRSDFDKLDHAERHRRIVEESCIVRDDDWQEQEAKAARVKAEVAAWRREHTPTMKRADWDKLSEAEKSAFVLERGGQLVD